MIIMNQERNELFNFSAIESIYICCENNYFEIDSNVGTLGIYKTEERAREVLQEIVNLNVKFGLYKTMLAGENGQAIMLDNFSNNNIKFDTYEMPKE